MGWILLSWCLIGCYVCAAPFSIQFGIPEEKIVRDIPQKTRDFAFIIPGRLKTYIYQEESAYYQDYQCSYFAVTHRKAGWDCMRHYEILANGCIPYFLGLKTCDSRIMPFLPKELIREAMQLPGVSYLQIRHAKFDVAKYNDLLRKMLEHVRKYCTTRAIAQYVLDTMHYSGTGKVLYLSQDPSPDYLRETTLIGLKEVLGDCVVDVPKIPFIYTSYAQDIKKLYGKGMTYTKIVPDLFVDRENIEDRIRNKEFELIIYGSVHRGTPFLELVRSIYDVDHVCYLCGEDQHQCSFVHLPNLFLREF